MKHARTAVDVGGVLQTGRELQIRKAIVLPAFGAYVFPEPIDVAMAVRRVGRALELKGDVVARVGGECARCLDDVRLELRLTVDECFEPYGPRDGALADNNVITGDELDLDDLVRQTIDSALPLVLLCGDDCEGLCPVCGYKRNGTCRCTTPENKDG